MKVEPRPELLALPQLDEQPASDAATLAQRRAWTYIWTAFGVWCVLVAAGAFQARSWWKTAYLSPAAELVAKRGIVLYQAPRDALPVSISEQTPIEEGGILEVPTSAEAVIRIGVDNSTLRLRSGSKVRLATMRVGRFNSDLTRVYFEQLEGAVNYSIVGELPHGREVEIRTPQITGPSDTIKLTKGEYLIWVQGNGTRLSSYVGQAKAEIDGTPIRLRDGRWLMVGVERPEQKHVLESPEHLIKNRDFVRGLGESWSPIDIGEKGRPDVGGQRSVVSEIINGRVVPTLQLTRDTTKDTHNETGLRQEINREVWAFQNVQLSALVKVNHASLDGGGYAGSEYPIMLRVNYVAENGGNYTWAHGFYYKNETNRPTDVGEMINQGEWHRFTLDMTTLRDRPAYIASVDVVASGHDFSAQVAEVQLIVE